MRKGVSELYNPDTNQSSARQPLGSEAPIDIGSTVEGTVVKLAEYGAIVRLQGGRTGLIHVSEIADAFVRDVKEYFKEHDRVRVKVLSINDKGRYELSTKNIEQPAQETPVPRERKKPIQRPPEVIDLGPDHSSRDSAPGIRLGFEDRISGFLKDSQERQTDVKKHLDSKRGTIKKR